MLCFSGVFQYEAVNAVTLFPDFLQKTDIHFPVH